MVLCKFFLQGTCKYGDYCKFDHQINENYSTYQNQNSTSILRQSHFGTSQPSQPATNPTNVDTNTLVKSVVNDMTSAEKGGQWLLSCYAPYKEKPAFPGFEDQSFEEVRLGYYEAVKNGTVEQYKQQIQMMLQQAMMKLKSLQSPSPDIINILKSIYNTPAAPSAGVYGTNTTTTSNMFGNATNAGISFTQSQPTNFSQQPGSSIFAQSNQNLFGQPAQNKFAGASNSIFGGASQSGNIFGGQVQATNSPFGNNQQQNQSANKSIFGQANANFATQGGSIFGARPQGVQPSTTGIFGGSQPTNNSIFGGQQITSSPGFGVSQNNSPFASQNTNLQMQTSNNSVFSGQTRAPFEQTGSFVAQNASSPFSQPALPTSTSIFGAPPNTQVNQPFGAPPTNLQNMPQQTVNFVLNQPQNQTAVASTQSSIFGQQNAFSQTQQQTAPFSQQTTGTVSAQSHSSSIFGGNLAGGAPQPFQSQTQQIDESLYSKLEDLTEEERKWFESDDLDILKMPEKPPTYQMCFNT